MLRAPEQLLLSVALALLAGCGSCVGDSPGGSPAPGGSIGPSGQRLLTTAGADSARLPFEAVPTDAK